MQISNIPLKWYVPFATNDGAKVEIPVTTADPARASQSLGFPPLTMQPPESGGVPPQGEDFNGAMNQVARIAWWVMAGGPFKYDASFATNANINGYAQGARLPSSDFLGAWISTADNNTADPDVTGTGWVPSASYGNLTLAVNVSIPPGGTVTLLPSQAIKTSVTVTGTLTSNLTLVVPNWLYAWRYTNSTTGAFTTTVKTAAGAGIVIPQNGAPARIASDGTNVTQLQENVAAASVSTAPVQLGQLGNVGVVPGRLLRTSIYRNISGVLNVSLNGGALTPASSTFTPLTATSVVHAIVIGGGGGGYGPTATGVSQTSVGAGGGGGGCAIGMFSSGFSGATVTVGASGAPGNGGNGGNGGTSSFLALSSSGGSGGSGKAASAVNNGFNGGGAPGTGSGSPAESYVGSSGSPGFDGGSLLGGVGGASIFGCGGVGSGGNTTGGSGGAIGSGGGSGANGASQAARIGGAGIDGTVMLYEYA